MKRLLFVAFVGLLAVGAGVYAGIGWYRVGHERLTMAVDTSDTTADQYSYVSNSFAIRSGLEDYTAVKAYVVVDPAEETAHGFGLADSIKLVLQTTLDNIVRGLDSVTKAGLPCTLQTKFIDSDTMLLHELRVSYRIVDSTSDTVFTAHYPVEWNVILKGN